MKESKMRANSFDTGVAAEYFILSMLYRQGNEAYISQGNKKAIDIRAIRKDGTPVSIDVKAVRGYSSLNVNNVAKGSKDHVLVFVVFNNKFDDIKTFPDVFIVPSLKLAKLTKAWKEEKRVMKGALMPFKDQWEHIA